jgi:DNA polymerase-3 subunit delta
MAEKNQAYQQLKKDIAAGTLQSIYIFHGEETYLREYYLSQAAKKLVPAGFEEFNFHKVEGKGLSVQALAELTEAMPMLSERTLVQVVDFDIFKLNEEQRKAFVALLEDFPEYCCLIFVYDQLEYKPNKTMKTLHKAVEKAVSVVKFETQSRSDLLNWIARRFRANNKGIDPQTAEHLIFTCGSLMNGLIPEIEKVSAYAKGSVVTKEDIDAVAAPILEAQVFEMTAAISKRDFDRAADILGTLLKLQEEPIMLLAIMGKELRKLHTARLAIDNGKDKFWLMEQWGMRSDYPAKLLLESAKKVSTRWAADAVRRCQELDLKMKSVNGTDSVAELKFFLMELAQEAKR